MLTILKKVYTIHTGEDKCVGKLQLSTLPTLSERLAHLTLLK